MKLQLPNEVVKSFFSTPVDYEIRRSEAFMMLIKKSSACVFMLIKNSTAYPIGTDKNCSIQNTLNIGRIILHSVLDQKLLGGAKPQALASGVSIYDSTDIVVYMHTQK